MLHSYHYHFTAPTGTPQNVVPSTTSRSISVSWDAIDCIERNGNIDDYEVEFRRSDGSETTEGVVVGQTFTAIGLQFFTAYTFRVAGVNSAGRGPFTAAININTNEDSAFLTTKPLYRLLSHVIL